MNQSIQSPPSRVALEPAVICASYERVSTKAQGQYGYSLEGQRQSIEDFTRAQGWILPEHLRFRDGENENASGTRWDLPGLTAMLDAAQRRAFNVLVVTDFDRLSRNRVKATVLKEQLRSYGIRVVYQRVPTDDSPEGKLQEDLMDSIAEYDRAKTSLRLQMGKRNKANTGQVVGTGKAPYGYRFVRHARGDGKLQVVGLEEDPITGPIVRRIFRELVTRSTIEIAAHLRDAG
jgi:site-specific DNA recombinase